MTRQGGPYQGRAGCHRFAASAGHAGCPLGAEYVPLDCLSRRDHPAGRIRDRARPLPGGAERALRSTAAASGNHRHQLVRPSQRARALPRGPAGLVDEFALSLPAHPLASLFCPRARLYRHPDHAPELPSLCLRPLAVHAQRHDRQLVAAAPEGGGASIPDEVYGSRIGTTDSEAIVSPFSAPVATRIRSGRPSASSAPSPTWSAAKATSATLRRRSAQQPDLRLSFYRDDNVRLAVLSGIRRRSGCSSGAAGWRSARAGSPVPPGRAIVAAPASPVLFGRSSSRPADHPSR